MERLHYRPWSKDEIRQIQEMARSGISMPEIVQAMAPHRDYDSVRNKFAALGGWSKFVKEGYATVRPVGAYAPPDGPTMAETFAPLASADESDEAFLTRLLGSATASSAGTFWVTSR